MFGFLKSFVEIKRVTNLRPNIMFGLEPASWKNKLSFWSHYPTVDLRDQVINFLFILSAPYTPGEDIRLLQAYF